jgi:adenine deaminase
MKTFIQNMPKAELHVHLEGTLEAEHHFSLAIRNNIKLDQQSPEELIAAYDFHDLPSFLKIYYAGMSVLRTEEDFYELTYKFFERAVNENVVYVEPFFDPQAHTTRGIAFSDIINGIHQAQIDAKNNFGIDSNLIMCFLREMSVESALAHLEMAKPYKDWIIGVGLDSNEKDNPPIKFFDVFKNARNLGWKLTMHCDVNQQNSINHIRQCLNDIQVDRIDHGINALEDESVCEKIKKQGLGLTICPISNRYVVQSLTSKEIRTFLDKGIKVTINSDDPAYFRAYLNDNFIQLQEEGHFTREEIVTLATNAFDVAWIPEAQKKNYVDELRAYAQGKTSKIMNEA